MHWRWGKGRASQGMVPRSAQFRARGATADVKNGATSSAKGQHAAAESDSVIGHAAGRVTCVLLFR